MIGRTAHSVRLLLRIGEMTVPSILGRRGCAPVIGPSDEGPKCRAYRDSSPRECVPRACCTSATCSGLRSSCHRIRRTRARFYTIIHRKSASFAALAGPVLCRVTSGSPCEYHLAQDNLDALQAQLNSCEKLVRLRDSPDKRPPLRTCQRRHNRASPISPTKQNKRDHAHPLHHMK